MMKTIVTRSAVATLVTTALAACSGTRGADETSGVANEELASGALVQWGTNAHAMPLSDGAPQPEAQVAAAAAHLTYFGGPVISHVKVVKVEYGAGTYQSFIAPAGAAGSATMEGFYKTITNSSYMDWLSEYNTTSPAQTIGRGTYGGDVQIAPASSRNKATITDANIQAELNAQIGAGKLPAPDANTLYMIHFPKGKRITKGAGSTSCVSGGFCAYHGTFVRNGANVYYGVFPDMSPGSGCDTGCGAGAPFANETSVSSHEMIEAVTDAAVGLATVVGKPLAWYDSANGEIGDICNGQQAVSNGYTVQKQWSNARGACYSQ